MGNERSIKLKKNIISRLLLEFINVIIGFILPRLILVYFGSEVNGLISSITQFLGYVTLLRSGIGVAKVALYGPLAERDMQKISSIVKATELFLRKIAWIFGAYILVLIFVYPLLVQHDFDWLFTTLLILTLSVSTFSQYYFGIAYQILLDADQKQYVVSLLSIASTIVNAVVSIALIYATKDIIIVKLGGAVVFGLQPLILYLYVRAHYQIDPKAKPDKSALGQRLAAAAVTVANFVHSKTDIVLLTIFSDLKLVSVYSVYAMVLNAMRTAIASFSGGTEAAFGNMLIKNEYNTVRKRLSQYELSTICISTVLFTCTAVLIVPFVNVYTKSVTDVEYVRPMFAWMIVLSEFVFSIRTPHLCLVQAAGHYRQTRNGAIIEAAINIVVSVIGILTIGFAGVALGTLVAMLFRTTQYAIYAHKYILSQSPRSFFTRFFLFSGFGVFIFILSKCVDFSVIHSYLTWLLYAAVVFVIVVLGVLFIAMIFYREDMREVIRFAFARKKGVRKNKQ